ncbi:MAG: hypothetical protein SAK29_31280 [Scytonema sp. PMC 1069.18]|nr:hypothetical protein [Scytonema sp. PMC 1069.18]MEC4886766.1 hypothetical protein [Scytonema sp. PMC 1070.18]
MVDRINDIAWQAHQGSVAAIIQVLNEKLADSGVRTRAIFDNGVLQLLCEARTVDKLEQTTLVMQIQQILESLTPRNIYRININTRMVREEQLLWLEEINRDPDDQLLWSQEITLVKPNIFQQLIKELKEWKTEQSQTILPKTTTSRLVVFKKRNKFRNSTVRAALGTSSLCVFLLSLTWAASTLLGAKLQSPIRLESLNSIAPGSTQEQKFSNQPSGSSNSSVSSDDSFAEAVRIANLASADGKTAKTSAQWLDLAARWQRASELMGSVPPSHSRYEEARIRTKLYKKYSETAEEESQKSPL